jgi:hypothetical protein
VASRALYCLSISILLGQNYAVLSHRQSY